MIGDLLIGAGAVIAVLLSVVLVHEGGHFLLAKLSGVRVDEFSVGFGPRLLARRSGETTYSLRAIPAGGYVKMAGMLGLEGEPDAGERNFYRATMPRRMATMLAGIVANMLFGALLFSLWFATPTASRVLPGEAAQAAGLRDGDSIVSVDGRPVRHDTAEHVATDLHAATAASAGRPLQVGYRHAGTVHTVTIKPSLLVLVGAVGTAGLPAGTALTVTAIDGRPVGTGDPAQLLGGGGPVHVTGLASPPTGTSTARRVDLLLSGVTDGPGTPGANQAAWRLGVQPGFDGQPLPSAVADGFQQIPTFVVGTVSGLVDLVTNPRSGGVTGPNGLSGPVGIAQETVTQARHGGRSLLYWIAFISLNLGFVNLLPIPFLDGGKFVLLVLEAVRRRRLDPRREALIYAVGLALVLLFAVYVTIGDVQRSL